MSSSAALEAGLAYAVNDLFRTNMDSIQLVKLSQKSENDFVGVNCGIMDQFINIFGKENKVLKIDCRSLDYQYYPFNRKDLKIVLCDTGSRRELASSEYNIRRHQCETGVAVLKKADAKIKSLRDVKLELLEGMKKQLDPVVYKRCHYVILENQRVESACRHLNQNNLVAFGKKMFESHRGLSKDYEVSSSELDLLVEIASTHSGVLGSRMMGAGFGGCTINLVEEKEVDSFIGLISQLSG
jgi:galactokinase